MDRQQTELEGISGILVADATQDGCPIVYVSPGFELITGYSAKEALGRSPKFLQGPDTDPRAAAALGAAIADGREGYATLLNYRADGTPFWNEVSIAPERDAGGRIIRWLGVQRDVTDRMRVNARLHELAYFDALTGLANRAALHDELRSSLHRARVHDREVALLLVDLDDFKRINEQHGHRVGDVLLRAVADRLRGIVRPQDLLARHGSDEFALLLKDLPGNANTVATDLAGRIVAALHEPFGADALKLEVHASIGVALFPSGAPTAAELVAAADTAVDVAKHAGKDRIHVHRPTRAEDVLRPDDAFDPASNVRELDAILERGALRAVFQPIVELASGDVVAYEALARGPEGSPLHRPDRLFAAARAGDRVVELDWACRAAAVQAALDAGLGRRATLLLNSEPAAAGSAVPGAYAALWARAERELDLVIEITERAILDRPAELTEAMERHRQAGHGVALDDIGADVRALALLPLVGPDLVKLDLRLVQDRPSADQAAIVSTVAAERERTGAAILAEGIETEAHADVARALGATLGQGWLFGRPGPLPGAHGGRRLARGTRREVADGSTPFDVVSAHRPVAQASTGLLLPMSLHLEQRALRIGEGAVILAAFQEAARFTPATRERYTTLARSASLVAAFGVGLPPEPAPRVRGAALAPDDPLADEWSVIVLGPHFAAALTARDLGDEGPRTSRRFAFATTYDRDLVLDAAQTLLRRIAPRVPSRATS